MVSMSDSKNIGKTTDLLTLVSSVLTFDRFPWGRKSSRIQSAHAVDPRCHDEVGDLSRCRQPLRDRQRDLQLLIVLGLDTGPCTHRQVPLGQKVIEGNSEFCGNRLEPVWPSQNRKSPISSKLTKGDAIDRRSYFETFRLPPGIDRPRVPPPTPMRGLPN